jgi:hypothetical protein
VSDGDVDIVVKFFSNSSLVLDLADKLDESSRSFGFSYRGFMYVAMPETTWVITFSYMRTYLYINSLDVRYFSGLSSFRPVFILAFVDAEDLKQLYGLDEPQSNFSLILVDRSFEGSDEPIFKLLDEADYISIYPEAYALELDTQTYYVDVHKLNEYFNLPPEVIYKGGQSFNLVDKPPVYILVNRDVYFSILSISEPVIKGNFLTLNLYVDRSLGYNKIVHTLDESINIVGRIVESVGFMKYSIYSPLKSKISLVYDEVYSGSLLFIILVPILASVIIDVFIMKVGKKFINYRRLGIRLAEARKLGDTVESLSFKVSIIFIALFLSILYIFDLFPYIRLPIYLFNGFFPAIMILHICYVVKKQLISR